MQLAGKKLTATERMKIASTSYLPVNNEADAEMRLCYSLEQTKVDYFRQVPTDPGFADILVLENAYWPRTIVEVKYQPDREALLKAIGQCYDYRSKLQAQGAVIVIFYTQFNRHQFRQWLNTAHDANVNLMLYESFHASVYRQYAEHLERLLSQQLLLRAVAA